MANRDVRVTFAANVSGFITGVRKAEAEARNLAAEVVKTSQINSESWSKVGSTLTRVGVGAAAALAMVGKSAIDWESQWAGVQKTVDGTAQQMAVLEEQLRGMARSMPASHKEIAAVAEAAGQLGVARDNVASFTKTMVMLGETTNLSADEAATSIAQFTNIMGTSQSDVGRLGAALVQLGNNGASTEKDIMELAHRLAGAGAMFKLSEGQVLGFGNAMASVGIEAEAGGTAMTMAFNQIDKAVRSGGSGLESLAKTAGMTGQQFKEAWSKNAAGATAKFIKGLGGVIKNGGDANKILDDLGMGGIRTADTMKRLASAGDLLTESLTMGEEAWESNSALVEEYAKRAQTTEARMQVAWNNIRDAAISVGEALLPIISEVANVFAYLAEMVGGIPKPIQMLGLGFLGLITTVGLLGGGLMKAVSAFGTFKAAVEALGWSFVGLQAKAGLIGLALAAVSVAVGVFIGNQAEAKRTADDYTQAMEGQTSAINDNTRAVVINHLEQEGLLKTAKDLGVNLADFTDACLGNEDALARVKTQMAATNQEGTFLSDGLGNVAYQASNAETGSKKLLDALEKENRGLQEGVEAAKMKAEAAGESTSATGENSDATSDNTDKINENTSAIAENIAKQLEEAEQKAGRLNAEIAFNSALDKTRSTTEELIAKQGELGTVMIDSAGNLDTTTEVGRQFGAQIADLINKTERQSAALEEAGASAGQMAYTQEQARQACYNAALQMTGNADAAQALTDKYFGIPDSVSTSIFTPGVFESTQAAIDFYNELETIPEEKRAQVITTLDDSGVTKAKSLLASLKDKVVNIFTHHSSDGEGKATGGYIRGPGTSTSDSIPAWLSNGEYVLRAAAVKQLGLKRLNHMNATGRVPGFASGGFVARHNVSPNWVRDMSTKASAPTPPVINMNIVQEITSAEIARIAARETGRQVEKVMGVGLCQSR